MLTHRLPYPPDRGDRIRAYHLLQAIAERFDVTLAAIADEPVASATIDRLDSLCDQILIAEAKPIQRRAAAARALLTGRAITPAALYDRALAQQLILRHEKKPFDTVLTYCTGMVGYARVMLSLPKPPRHVLDLVDVDSQKWAGFAKATRGPMRLVYQAESRRLKDVEAGRVVPFDTVTVISEAEAQRYREHVTDLYEPVVVGNGVDLDRFKADEPVDEPVIVFTGVMSYKPNIDAAVWFARRVMPRVLAAVPNARFDIVGKSPAREVLALNELPGVNVVGPVKDTTSSLQQSAVAVAPMQIAPGVQNKVLEAMACGLPVVCSSAAARGIDAIPGEHLLTCDKEAGTAATCVRLLLNPDERSQLGNAARYRVQQHYDWPSRVAPMLDLLDPNHSLLQSL